MLATRMKMAAASRSTLLDMLTAYWTLNEVSDGSGAVSRADSSGNGHTLTDFGTTASVAAKQSNGALFNVADQTRLMATHHADLNIGNVDWEMAGWCYITAVSAQQIITKAGTLLEFIFQMDATTDKFQWAVRNTSNAWVIVTATTFGIPATPGWVFFDVWHDATNNLIGIAINNGAADTLAFDANGTLNTSTAKLSLSSNDTAVPGVFFAGRLDEIGIWKGRLLTADERTSLYNGGAGNTYPFDVAAPTFDLSVKTAGDVTTYRAAMIGEIWSGGGFPATGADSVATGVSNPISATGFTNLASVDQLTIGMGGGFTSSPHVFRPTSSNNKLALVHQGHSTDLNEAGVGDTIRALSNAGYTVVGLLMIGSGSTATHNTYPAPTESLNYLRYFMEPMARAINELLGEGWDGIYMTGLSGGGWSTHLYAAIDTRIDASVAVAGSLPLDRTPLGGRDWEQNLPGLGVDYYDLYVLSASGGRTQSQILNYYEPSPFGYGPFSAGADYSAYIAGYAAAIGGTWALEWDVSHSLHQISAWAITRILTICT